MASVPTNPDQILQDVSLGSFLSALWVSGATGLAFYTAFTVLRPRFPLIYSPRTFLVPKRIASKPLKKWFSWMTLGWKMDDADTIRRIGADNWAAIYYMKMLLRLFIFIGLASAVILMPLYATGGNGQVGLNLLHMGNLPEQSDKLWATLIMSFLLVLGVIHFIFKILAKASWLRHSFVLGPDQHKSLSGYTLVVRDIPRELRDPAIIRDLFNRVQPNKVLDVILIRDVKEINKMYKKHMAARNNIEKACAKFLSNVAKQHAKDVKNHQHEDLETPEGPSPALLADRPEHKEKLVIGDKVDTIAHNLEQMRELEVKLKEKRIEAYAGLEKAESAAFVVFSDLYAPHVAALANIHGTPGVMWDKQAVVEPADVIWDNLDMKMYDRLVRKLFSTAALAGLVIGWGILTTFLAGIANLVTLVKYFPFLSGLLNLPQNAIKIIQGVLPTVAVAILFALLPILLRYLSIFSGAMTRTGVERELINQYFAFLVFNVLLIITVSGSIMKTLKDIEHDPSSVFRIMSRILPSAASFYINYISLLTLTGPAGELLQIASLVIKPLLLKFLSGTPRAIWQKSQPTFFQSGVPMAAHSFIATLGIVYMTIAPLIPLVCCVYFALWYMAYSYQMNYVYATRSQTGGFYMHIAAKQLFVALYLHQVIMVGLFLLSQAWVQTGIVFISIIITICAHQRANLYTELMRAIPAKAALDLSGKQKLTMDEYVQRALVSNEPWRDEVDAQLEMDQKSEHNRVVRQKTSELDGMTKSSGLPIIDHPHNDDLAKDKLANADVHSDAHKVTSEETTAYRDLAEKNLTATQHNPEGDQPAAAAYKDPKDANPRKEEATAERELKGDGIAAISEPERTAAYREPKTSAHIPHASEEVNLHPMDNHPSSPTAVSSSRNSTLRGSGDETPDAAGPVDGPVDDPTNPDEFEVRFMHPALRPDPLSIWIAKDSFGVSEDVLRPEIEGGCGAKFVYEDTTVNTRGKMRVPTSVIAREHEP
ncbi:hypothetical protein HKX48_005062 [Thoreauomyces humboldtii]|nr:hypothetical protein HKX48_005062 [Thoreauomyces humboldtii]